MMSSGGYPFAPPRSSASNILQTRRASGTLPLSYDRPPAVLPPHRSPSPGSSRRFSPYEGYPAPRLAPTYRDGVSTYPQTSYHPNNSYYSRTPSPDRRYGPSRDTDADYRDRSAPWQPPNKSPAWPDRRAPTLSPTSSVISRDRVRRSSDPIAVSRMFEPSDTWKQTQSDRPMSTQSPNASSAAEQIGSFRDHSPVIHGPPYFARGDRYRPDQNGRGAGRGDSYRPNYKGPQSIRQTSSSTYRPNPDLGGRYNDPPRRRASSPDVSIASSRSRRTSSRSRSPSRSRSASRSRSPSGIRRQSPGRGRRSISPRTGSDRRRTKSRSASRSSIASSRASDHPPSRHISPAPVLPTTNGASHGLETLRTPSPNSSESPRSAQGRQAADTNGADASHSQQRASQSPKVPSWDDSGREDSPIPGFGNDTRDTDVSIRAQMQQQQRHVSSPLPEDKPQEQAEMSQPLTTKSALPTWDVVPTVPETSTLDLVQPSAPPPPVSPSPIHVEEIHVPTPARSPSLEVPEPYVPEPAPTPPPVKTIPLAQFAPPQPQVDYVLEDIPRLADAKSIQDALRTVVMTRLLRDHQTREERVTPVLMENLSLALAPDDYKYAPKPQEQLIEDVSAQRLSYGSDDPFLAAKSWLYARFDGRRTALGEKTERLRLEYQALHQRWRRHCASLNVQVRPVESDTNVPVSGRTTRRSAANLGDTVRSDLEMEQIIASLGYDEATDPNQLSTRNLAIIPDMISVTGQTQYSFDDTNHLVENPHEYYAPYTGIHDWTEPEKELFLDKYAAFPKQFGVIASFLPNKTASQCVDYYYLHKKKLIDFRRVVSQFAPNKRRRRGTGKQKGNGLLSDIRQHDAEVNRDSDDSPSFTGRSTRGRRVTSEARKPSVRRNAFHLEGTTTGTPTPEPEARPKRRRAAVTNRSAFFQDDMDEDTDGEPKKKKRGRKPKSAAIVVDEFVTPLPTPPPIMEVDVDPSLPVRIQWSSEDKALFLDLLAQHGENFKRIAVAMPNKTTVQVTEYFKANLLDLDLASIVAKAVQISAVDQAPETSISSGTMASSAFSPSAFSTAPPKTSSASASAPVTPVVNGSASVEKAGLQTPPQSDEAGVATPALDPNAMWDSMDPGSGRQSPNAERPQLDSPGLGPGPSSTDPVHEPTPPSAVKPPPMASLARDSPVAEATANRSSLHSLKIPKYASSTVDLPAIAGPSAVQVSQNTVTDTDASRRNSSEMGTAPAPDPKYPATVPAPVMSSLHFDPSWGYYDPDGANRTMLGQPTAYPDNARPYSPSHQPVPYVTLSHPPTRPPAGTVSSRPPPMVRNAFGVAFPYYPYSSTAYPPTSYPPHTSYKP